MIVRRGRGNTNTTTVFYANDSKKIQIKHAVYTLGTVCVNGSILETDHGYIDYEKKSRKFNLAS